MIDLDESMRLLLEQELMAGLGSPKPVASPVAVDVWEGTGEGGSLEDDVLRLAARALRMQEDRLDPTENLANFGVDSIAITEIMASISRFFGIAVAPTTFFEARNLNDLARILHERHAKAIDAHYAKRSAAMAVSNEERKEESDDEMAAWLSRHRTRSRAKQPAALAQRRETARKSDVNAPIAIIAMEGMFPQSPDLEAFERHLRLGNDCIEEVPADRWDWRAVYGDPRKGNLTKVNTGGFVSGHDLFDAGFFHISPREAEMMDPQHRLFMQCVWSLIEKSGHAPGSLKGRQVGLFLGINLLDYVNMANRLGLMDAQQMTGLGHSFCPNRLSFLLDIHGPSQVVDTACSSSLVALHRAIMSIRYEGCEMAIAGGTNLMLSPEQHILYSKLGMLAADGRCKSFSRRADGYARADGVGAVLLKPLDKAEQDGDPILGVILASAEHHGGAASSLTAPNPQSQARLIADAHRQAGIDPRSVSLIECHGTGTSLGDPIEVEGLKLAFKKLYEERGLQAPKTPSCGLGSVKSNIGHTETTAGIAGLIKVLLAMQNGTLYQSLHCEDVNPLIDLHDSPFYLLNQQQPWRRLVIDGFEAPRRAGVSSFGAGGTNVHVVIEEYRPRSSPASAPGASQRIVPVSAHSDESLRLTLAALRRFVDMSDLDDLAYTLQVGRDAMRHRVAFVAEDRADLARQIDAFLQGKDEGIAHARVEKRRKPETMPTHAEAAQIAAGWVVGADIDWSSLHKEGQRRRLTLPGTSFVRKSFWLPERTAQAAREGFVLKEAGADRWLIDISGDEFFLADHRLHDQPILPGAAYLELARAVAERAGIPSAALRNVVWIQPLAVSGPVKIELKLIRKDEGGAKLVEIASLPPGAARIPHAQIRLADIPPSMLPPADLDKLRAEMTQVYKAENIYALFGGMGLNYGPAHRAITYLATGRDAKGHPQVLAHLSLPDGVVSTLSAYPLHPSLMDGVFQSAIGMVLTEGGQTPQGAALPFALADVEMLEPCAASMWVHIRLAEGETAQNVQTSDMDVMDEQGKLLIRLKGFSTRLAKAKRPGQKLLGFASNWLKQELATTQTDLDKGTVLLVGGVGDVNKLADLLPGWSCRAVAARPALDEQYLILSGEVMAELQSPKQPQSIWVVIAEGPDADALAGVAGMLRSAAMERSGLGGCVLIVPPETQLDRLARLLRSTPPVNAIFRQQNDQLLRQAWEPVPLPESSPPWQDGKTYLITGGLGGLGRLLAKDILDKAPAASVVLVGRSAPGASDRQWLDGFKGRLRHVQADLSDPAAVAFLIEDIRRVHGRLDGVFHAAGLIQDGPLSGKTQNHLAAVLAPKVAGVVHLDRVLGDAPLDFFVLFSSLSGSMGNVGQADYAAANAFLDGFAVMRNSLRQAKIRHGRTLSIAWPLWRDGGMNMDDQIQTLMTRTTGLTALESEDGLKALASALACDLPQVLIAVGDEDKIRRTIMGRQEPPPPVARPAPSSAQLRDRAMSALMEKAARQLKVAMVDLAPDTELTEYGFDSIGFTQFTNILNDAFDLELTPTVFFEHPTLAELAVFLAETHGEAMARHLGIAVPQPPPFPEEQSVPVARPVETARPVEAKPDDGDAVAIIGMSCHFPKARTIQEFWRNLEQERDCITEIPSERWNWRDYWGNPLTEAGRCDVRWGGFIDGVGEFDAAFFGLSAPEARMMDPQQRLLLTQAWRLIESAGYAPRQLAGSSTGVFIGTADSGYGRLLSEAGSDIEGYSMTGLAPSLGPNRISYHFNFHGPSQAVETACSSALVAVHRAAEAIRHGQCETAIAGGINLLLMPDSFVGFAKAGMLAKDGHCKPFSADADGYARGEGVGLVFLKRLSAAERDGDRILGIVRASSENHGGHASSLTAPNPKAQAALLRDAYRKAGFDPRTVGYIEAHGTGTPLGDPIEIEALSAAFADLDREAQLEHGPAMAVDCGIGSVKSNIGHLELAAGVAGLIKVLLQFEHGVLVKSLHCDTLNPYLKLQNGRFHVVRETAPWTRCLDGRGHELPRRAGVSSYGFGGANAHVVVEEYLPRPKEAPTAPIQPELIVLSAHSPEALGQWAQMMRDHIAAAGTVGLSDIAYTLQVAREAMEHRLAFVTASSEDAVAKLQAFLDEEQDAGLHQGRVKPNRAAMAVLENDPPFQHAALGLLERGNADGLLELWVRGLTVNWKELRRQASPRRVALPSYPLASTVYWVRRGAAAPPPVRQPSPAPVQTSAPTPTPTPKTATAPTATPVPSALEALTDIAARVLEIEPNALHPDTELGDFGFDSLSMTTFASKVNAELNLSLTPADFFEFATLSRLAKHIAGSMTASPPRPEQPAFPIQEAEVPNRPPLRPLSSNADPIAIVGFSCRFPQALDADDFWNNLLEGRDCISRIPADRWDWRVFDGDPKTDHGKTNVHWGGFIDGVFDFDPLFFGISPREAKLMDPQQRLALLHAWKAIEDSGHAPRSLAGCKVGVFIATSSSGYREIIGDDTGAEGYVATGSVPSIGPNRISYFLNWHGPSEPVETACSSSLVALHRAILAMQSGDCDMAVVGGVNTIVTPEAHINFAKAGMLSLDGRCKTFSAQANGYGRGEGVGMVVLKRLSEAQRDRDPIIAVVKGCAVGHGGRANSLTAPNTHAQAELLREAQSRADIDPSTIGYIEAHGTGTPLGDPVEINALKAVFGGSTFTDEEKSQGAGCAIGSVKSNIGHLELAAGIAGIIKVLLQMQHRTLVASLHCQEINPYIDLKNSPLSIVRENRPWRPIISETGAKLPLRAGISSFGFGGVNAHVILEAYQPPEGESAAPTDPVLIVLSARDAQRLRDQANNLLAFLDRGRVAEADLADLAYTLQIGRDAMAHRLAIPVATLAELRRRLTDFLNGDTTGMAVGTRRSGQRHDPALPLGTMASLEVLAATWSQGGEVDWQSLYRQPRRRLRLPTYPFARETYLIGATFIGQGAALAQTAPQGFTRRLDAKAFYLRDHKVRGVSVLPGAMGLELACAAFADGQPFAPLSISRVVWQRPLQLARGEVTVMVPLTHAQDGGQDFSLISGGQDSTPHMLGRIAPLAPRPAVWMDLKGLQERCSAILEPDWLYASFSRLGLDYGPAFRAIESIRVGKGEALARLRLPAAAQGHEFHLHPSLLDGAFQAILGLFHEKGGDETALPFAMDGLEALSPTSNNMWAHIRQVGNAGGVLRLDIDMADDEGNILVGIKGFALRLLKSAAPTADIRPATIKYLTALVAREAAIPPDEVEADAPLEIHGIDSIMIVRLTDMLEHDFGPLPKTLFFEYRTLSALAGYFLSSHAQTLAQVLGVEPPQEASKESSSAGGAAPSAPIDINTPIAIIGMAGRFPGAQDLDQFWGNLESGRDCITEIPPDRWDHSKYFNPTPGQPGKTNSKWGGFLDGIDCFDPLFFNISPREAEYMDPQERLFLQCSWEALEDAGYTRANISPSEPPLDGGNVGVFVGLMYQEYQLFGAERTAADQPMALNGSAASIANRVSYFCGFHGPSLTLDSMCSSSLTAIHLACQSLRGNECKVALAGGVNLSLHPNKYLGLAQGRFMSSNGRCESFGKGGDGYVPSEGVGAVLLKPLNQAIADGDRILGVIRSSALNHGGKTNGYTVPNPDAQAAVIGKALDAAGVDPGMVSYVEAHGTGTSLGDPIEIAALTKAYGKRGGGTGSCAIGSVKSNIGHCESAAGMAGLAKVLLQFKHRKLVPSLHAETLNPGIDFSKTPFTVQRHLSDWRAPVGGTRIAGLSSFGAGGANAHLILEEYSAASRPVLSARQNIFPLSARDPARLAEMIRRLRDALVGKTDDDLASVAFVLQEGREAFEERLAIVAGEIGELRSSLDRALANDFALPGLHRARIGRSKDRKPSFVGDLDQMAAAWVAGTPVDWASLRAGHPQAARISLPTYPFAKERYWVPGTSLEIRSSSPAPALSLPLLFAPRWQNKPARQDLAILPERQLLILCNLPARQAQQIAEKSASVDTIVLNAGETSIGDRYQSLALELLDRLQRLFKERPASALVQLAVPGDGDGGLLQGLAGMLRTASLERPGLRCQMVALDDAVQNAADLLAADRQTQDNDISHVGGERQVRHWIELSAQGADSLWKDDGVYLITGGAGGVGLHLCEAIARQARRTTLWLVGRSPLAETVKQRLCALDAHIEFRQADLADLQAIERVAAEIRREQGRLNGVLHAAGMTRDMLLVRKSASDLKAVFAPKVAGTINLDAATADFDLDFMILFASASGALGNSGQADYAAANAFLDAFAASRNQMVAKGRRQGRTLSIDWPYWDDGGMRIDSKTIAAMERLAGTRPLKTSSAMASLHAAFSLGEEPQILVLEGDHERLRKLVGPTQPSRAASPPAPEAARNVTALVASSFAEVLKIPAERLDSDATLDRFGVDSVSALAIVASLERHFGPLPPSILFEYPSISQLGAELATMQKAPQVAAPAAPASNDIAIIAVAGRYPGADSIEDFWTLLSEGRDCISEVPTERWDLHYSPVKGKTGSSHCKWGGFISGADCFDASFFGYTPRQAALADPQERLFLETAWHLLERANLTREMLRHRYGGKVGVFVGAMFHAYGAQETDADSKSLLFLNSYASIANHVSYFFDLQGPSVAVDSMCSSGLQAVHQACQSLRFGECRLAIAGGVNLSLLPLKYQGLSRAGLLGSHDDSRAFADGDGYLPAEGVGAVLLKPLAQALDDGDSILAVVKASSANHGGHSAGFGIPSADAQASLIEENLRRAGIDARTISYVEAAASGAKLGDAIEIRALTRAFRAFTEDNGFCAIGSVKTNMGHAEAASGLAQLTKVVLQLQHERLAPSLKPKTANPAIVFEGTPFRPQWQACDWMRPVVGGREQPRRAAISSFGAGGSNVHLVLEEAPQADRVAPPVIEAQRPRRFPVSARTPKQLAELLSRLAALVQSNPTLSLARMSYTLRQCRERFDCAVQIVASNRAELADKLSRASAGAAIMEQLDLPDEASGPPLVLPGYPFARQRHWIEKQAPSGSESMVGSLLDLILGTLSQELGRPMGADDADLTLRALGADSMTALRLGYVVEERTGLALSQLEIEDHPTPRRLAAFVNERTGGAISAPMPTQAIQPTPSRDSRTIPMTEGQKGLWVVQSLYPTAGTYNVPMAFRISGIDNRALGKACKWLLDAYPVLSSRVRDDVDPPALEAVKIGSPLRRVKVPKGMDPVDFAKRQALRPFDMKSDPLSRFELLHGKALGDGHEILLITIHHMAFDGASAWIASQALWEAYGRFASGQEAPPLPVAADFADFVAWEQSFMASPRGEREKEFWRRQLSGELPITEISTKRLVPPGNSIDGQSLERIIDPETFQAAKRAAVSLGITTASFFLGVLAILLYRHSGQQEMLVGVPSLRRPESRFKDSVGYFVNMLALRLRVPQDAAVSAFLQGLNRQMMEALDNGNYPFAAIARQLSGSLHGEPPYQISYAYQNFPMNGELALAGKTGQAVFLSEIRQQGDGPFGIELYEEGGGLRLIAGYDGSRFDTASAQSLLDRFLRLASAICDAPERKIVSLEMLSPSERLSLLKKWSKAPPLKSRKALVPEMIADQAASRPNAIAVSVDGESLTYKRLIRRANRLARHLRKCGVTEGETVAVLLGRNGDSVITLLAILSIGAVWVPLDADAPDQRLADMLADSSAKVIVTKDSLAKRVALIPHPAKVVVDLRRDSDLIASHSAKKLKPGPAPSTPAYMIYTSGSTGIPKGVLISHQAIADHCRAVIGHYQLKHKDVVLQFAPHVVDTALEQILPTLISGGRIVMRSGSAWPPDALRNILAEQEVTVADLPPAYLREVLLAWKDEPGRASETKLRLCIVGGEALPPETVRLWQDSPLKSIRLLNAYGPTEATITCLTHDVGSAPVGATIPIGRPLPGVEAYILDRDGNFVPEGVVGELHIGGSRLAIGYHGQPDLTREKFIEPPSTVPAARLYRTGDLASFVPGQEGVIAFRGRIDQQVKIRGFRVELGEIKAALDAFGLRDGTVTARPDGNGGQVLVAYVVPSSADFDEASLHTHMAARLPTHMLPVAYVRLDSLPITTSGKLDYAALPAPRPPEPSGDLPRDRLEERLQQVWSRVLGMETGHVGIHDDFQNLGGHSLLWVRLLAEVGRELRMQLPTNLFLTAQTVAEQAQLLRPLMEGDVTDPWVTENKVLVPLNAAAKQAKNHQPPFFLIHPIAGTVSCYVGLARRLDKDLPIYGLQSPGVDKSSASIPEQTLPKMAARYIEELRGVQGEGPYRLGGWSMGGVIGFEMARQLRRAGEKVSLLCLIDSYAPELLRQFDRLDAAGNEEEALFQSFARNVLGLAEPPPLAPGIDAVRAILSIAPFEVRETERLYRLFVANHRALAEYRPEPCDVPLTLLKAASQPYEDKTCGWGSLALEEIASHEIPGDHFSVLQPPNLDACAFQIEAMLSVAASPNKTTQFYD